MKVKDVCKRLYDELGIHAGRNRVNYYATRGLIKSSRLGNNYRDFTEKEFENIKLVAAMTDIGISTSDISSLKDKQCRQEIMKQVRRKEQNIEFIYSKI